MPIGARLIPVQLCLGVLLMRMQTVLHPGLVGGIPRYPLQRGVCYRLAERHNDIVFQTMEVEFGLSDRVNGFQTLALYDTKIRCHLLIRALMGGLIDLADSLVSLNVGLTQHEQR